MARVQSKGGIHCLFDWVGLDIPITSMGFLVGFDETQRLLRSGADLARRESLTNSGGGIQISCLIRTELGDNFCLSVWLKVGLIVGLVRPEMPSEVFGRRCRQFLLTHTSVERNSVAGAVFRCNTIAIDTGTMSQSQTQ